MKKLTLTALTIALAALAPAALGQSAQSNLAVSASVAANCAIETTPVAFGAYDPLGANATNPLNNSGTVKITCTKGSGASITLGLGANASGTTRRMVGGASSDHLTYELYQPPSTTPGTACTYPAATVWGTSGSNVFASGAAPSKAARTYNVCGTIPGGQDPTTDSYSDTVVATVNF